MTKAKYILFYLLSLISLSAWGQLWETTLGDTLPNVLNTSLLTPNESLLSAGYSIDPITAKRNLWLTKTNAAGTLEWERFQSFPEISVTAQAMVYGANNQLFIFGSQADTVLKKGVVWEVNAAGQTQNSWFDLPDDHLILDAVATNNGSFLVAGSFGTATSTNTDAFIGRLNANFDDFEWVYYYSGTSIESCSKIIQLSNGQYAANGYTASFGNGSLDAFLLLFDEQGTIFSEQTYGTNLSEIAFDLIEFDGKIWMTGQTDLGLGTEEDVFLLTTTLTGDSLQYQVAEQGGLQIGRAIAAHPGGQLYITGETRINANPLDLLLQQWDSNSNLQWSKQYGGPLRDNGKALSISPTGDIYIVGGFTQLTNGIPDGYILHPASDGSIYSAQVNGQVYWDSNENCTNDAEQSLADWLVEINGANTNWTTTDAQGNYSFSVDTGDYQVIVYPPNDYWLPCDFSIPVTVALATDTLFIEHGIKTGINCPLLTVDLGTPFLRRCFENIYSVQVCNQGTLTATDARVEITLDEYFSFINSSIPGSTTDDQLYSFELGDIAPLDCVNFNLTILVDCDSTVLGQTHCMEARAWPDSICSPINANWDNSSIELDAVCLGDSVEFIISNTGNNSTSVPIAWVIIEDHIMLYQGEVGGLDPGADTLIRVPAIGGTLRMETDQSPGHPGMSMPSITVEGCGGFPFSLGFVIQYPQDDGNPFVDIDCRENVGSYDPNDKQAFPAGYKEDHFIPNDTELEYLIRFQNTGTDTAFNIVIRDTLDSNLDLSSIALGSASHPYRWNLLGSNILEVHFNNILLPDSTTNEIGSNGYVKFTIQPKTGLAPSTQIFNQAAIFFDFNPPIFTNNTFHTIGIDYIIIDLIEQTDTPQEIATQIDYYPNPFLEHINFELINIPAKDLMFKVFNAQGILIHVQDIDSNRFSYHHKDPSPGVYFFQVLADRKIIKTGKIIHHN